MLIQTTLDPDLLARNRDRLMTEMRKRMRMFEARYELPTSRLEVELSAGRIRETKDICDWLFAKRTYEALEREQ